MNKTVQAKNIPDEVILAAVSATQGANGAEGWSSLWDIQASLPQYPAKVVLAKLASLVKRKKLRGCTCGCRGDFEII